MVFGGFGDCYQQTLNTLIFLNKILFPDIMSDLTEEAYTMPELTTKRLVGPLKTIREGNFMIGGFLDMLKEKIGLIGDTYAGKTQVVKALTHTLGGVYQECHTKCRTLEDSSYVFAEVTSDEQRQTMAVGLKTHAGHEINEGDKGPRAQKNIVVIKYLKTSTPNMQFGLIQPIIEREGISYQDCIALLTRVTDLGSVTTRRRNMIMNLGFRALYPVDNPKRTNYSLGEMDTANVDAVLDLLRDNHPSAKLIYFQTLG
jgi:hypothetical protein